MTKWIALVGLVAALGSLDPVAAQEPEKAPAIERCREFCGRVYGETGSQYEDCALACVDADACHRDCKQKFGTDQPKVHSCLRVCMRRGEPPEAAGAPEAPVKL